MADFELLDAKKEMDELDARIDNLIFMRQTVQKMMIKYPDLKLWPLEDGDYMLCSSSVNRYVDDFDQYDRPSLLIEHDNESNEREIVSVEVWPYTVVDDHRIYSNPPCFIIGEVNNKGFGVKPFDGWEDQMSEHDICNTAIRKARNYLRSKPPITYLEDNK